MTPIPPGLLVGPFTNRQAHALGVSARMLMGNRFVRVFPSVYRASSYEMRHDDWIHAARLAVPSDARLTSITRLQLAGLDFGPRFPLRFVVARDLHLDIDEVFLHRTRQMPPSDARNVTPAAAFLSYCALARVLDAIKVGDWLLHRELMTVDELRALALAQLWRPGAHEALWVLPHLDPDARSLPESETRSLLTFAGLPRPRVNRPIQLAPGAVVMGDLWYPEWHTIIEYEGCQHQEDRGQYNADIDRYALMRKYSIHYVQATKEKLRRPSRFVGEVHRELVRRGYDRASPSFGDRWELLFASLSVAVGPRSRWDVAGASVTG